MIRPKLVTDRATVLALSVPQRTESYTPIPCQLIFDTIDKLLPEFNLVLSGEEFLLSNKGKQQRLRFFFSKGNTFVKEIVVLNSYDMSIALRAASGESVFICSNGVIIGDIKVYGKHTSNIDEKLENFLRECFQEMNENSDYVEHMSVSYTNIIVEDSFIADTLGRFFFQYDYLNSSQLNIIKKEFKKPTHNYQVDPKSLWAFYQHVTFALSLEPADNYLETRRGIQKYFADYAFEESPDARYYQEVGELLVSDYYEIL